MRDTPLNLPPAPPKEGGAGNNLLRDNLKTGSSVKCVDTFRIALTENRGCSLKKISSRLSIVYSIITL